MVRGWDKGFYILDFSVTLQSENNGGLLASNRDGDDVQGNYLPRELAGNRRRYYRASSLRLDSHSASSCAVKDGGSGHSFISVVVVMSPSTPQPISFKANCNSCGSSRRTLYVMGTATALLFVSVAVVAAASSVTAAREHDNPLAAQPQASGEPEFHRFVAAASGQEEDLPVKNIQKRQSRPRESFSLSEIVDNVYSAESWNGTWVSDTEYAYRNPEGGLALLSIVTRQSRTIVPSSVMNNPARVFRFWVSADLQYVLLAMRPQKLFRHSFIAIYDIYNIATGERTKLQPPESVLRNLRPPGPSGGGGGGGGGGGPPPGPPPGRGSGGPPQLPLMYAEWAPTGSGIAYVFSNNVFYRSNPTADDITITDSGLFYYILLAESEMKPN